MLDDEIKKNMNKCARCALCVQNCPIYQIKKDENNTARGLICKLSGLKKGELTDIKIKNDLKICLNCFKCKKNCPSKVDTELIFSYNNAFLCPSKFSQRLFLIIKLFPIKILYFLNFFKKNKIFSKKTNILYFKGCVANAQHKVTFLDSFFYNPKFFCCGIPYLAGGDLKNYEKSKLKNIEMIKTSKVVIFDCASCKSAVSSYFELSAKEKEKLKFFVDFFENSKFILKNNSKYKNKKITFHKPCHLDENDFEKIEKFLKSIEGIEYIRMDEIDNCCGFGGSYFMYHPIISTKIAIKKAKDIKKTKADLILTACPSCTLGLRYNQIISFNFRKTLEIRDFIENELEIIN